MRRNRRIKTVSFAEHEQDLLTHVERRGPFSSYVKRLLRADLAAEANAPDPQLLYLMGQVVAACVKTLRRLDHRSNRLV